MFNNSEKQILETNPENFEKSKLYQEFSPYKSELLKSEAKNVWEENLPPKIKRRLLLLKSGFDIDKTQLHIPKEKFISIYEDVIQTLQKDYNYENIGINTAILQEKITSMGTPLTIIGMEDDKDLISEKFSALNLNKLNDDDYLIVYKSLWPDRENIVGGNINYRANPSQTAEKIDEHYIIEMQKSAWPRSIDPPAGNFINIEKAPVSHTPKTNYPKHYQPVDPVLERCRQSILSFARNHRTKDSVSELYEATKAKEIVLEWQYYKDELTILDFHFR